MAAPRNMKPKRMPTVATEVMLKRNTSTPINSHAMPVIRNSHQFFANPVGSLRISVSIRTPPEKSAGGVFRRRRAGYQYRGRLLRGVEEG